MDLDPPETPSPRLDPILPMVNLVFLLLIFLLLAATLAPRPPVTVDPPRARAADRLEPGVLRLALNREGALVFRSFRGADALEAVEAEIGPATRAAVALHADRAAPAAAVARGLADLASRGAAPVWLVVEDER